MTELAMRKNEGKAPLSFLLGFNDLSILTTPLPTTELQRGMPEYVLAILHKLKKTHDQVQTLEFTHDVKFTILEILTISHNFYMESINENRVAGVSFFETELCNQLVFVFQFGAIKYPRNNWMKGLFLDALLNSAVRHLQKIAQEQLIDEESGLPNIAHIIWNVLVFYHFYVESVGYSEKRHLNNL